MFDGNSKRREQAILLHPGLRDHFNSSPSPNIVIGAPSDTGTYSRTNRECITSSAMSTSVLPALEFTVKPTEDEEGALGLLHERFHILLLHPLWDPFAPHLRPSTLFDPHYGKAEHEVRNGISWPRASRPSHTDIVARQMPERILMPCHTHILDEDGCSNLLQSPHGIADIAPIKAADRSTKTAQQQNNIHLANLSLD